MAELRGEVVLSASGIGGLDEVLGGGFTANRLYLIEGDPGAGKTTLALRYLLEGVARGENSLYITLSETREEFESVASSHGWSLDGLDIVELVASEDSLARDAQSMMYHPSETELGETTKAILDAVERIKPHRLVLDSLSEVRLLAQSPLRYRREILALKQFFAGRKCTVLLLDDRTADESDLQVRSIAHGVVTLEQLSPEYGAERRRLRVVKLRGKSYRGGYHDFVIVKGGLNVFPRLVAAEHHREFIRDYAKSGISHLDQLIGGGLDRGTSTLIMGPAGSGKSSVGSQYIAAAAERGEKAAIFAFDESRTTLLARAQAIGMNLKPQVAAGNVIIQQIDPAELSPGEFVNNVRERVEQDGCRLIMIDSLNGYLNAMPEERFLVIQLHELLTYLGQKGVTTILVVAQHGLIGSDTAAPVDLSYLADSVILTRYFETSGRVCKAISVLKKRSGMHEATIRELRMGKEGISVSEPLSHLRGVLTGTPAPSQEVAERRRE